MKNIFLIPRTNDYEQEKNSYNAEEYYDEYYEDFKNTYGEEFMQYLTEVADMFRG